MPDPNASSPIRPEELEAARASVRETWGPGPRSLAARPFWLDGGYDRESVEACPYHPAHRWWEFALGDVLSDRNFARGRHGAERRAERMVVCRACYVPRCGSSEDTDPCLLPRHHAEPHHYRSGVHERVGGYGGRYRMPSCRCLEPRT